jgi:hypothetical protein
MPLVPPVMRAVNASVAICGISLLLELRGSQGQAGRTTQESLHLFEMLSTIIPPVRRFAMLTFPLETLLLQYLI